MPKTPSSGATAPATKKLKKAASPLADDLPITASDSSGKKAKKRAVADQQPPMPTTASPPEPAEQKGAKKRRKTPVTTVIPSPPLATETTQGKAAKKQQQQQQQQPGTDGAVKAGSGSGGAVAGRKVGSVEGAQVSRAVQALLTHIARESAELLDESPPIHVTMATKQMPKAVGKAKACKPVPLALPHPFVDLETADICVITKDPQREYKDRLAATGLSSERVKVIGVSKLKKKFHEYEAKRNLRKAYELFVADAAILPMLPPLLGKTFFTKRRLPTPIDLKKKDLRAELQRVAGGTTFRHSAGTSNSFQVGTAAQTVDELTENVLSAVEQVVERLPGKWSNLQALNLRTTNSVALPFYNSLPSA